MNSTANIFEIKHFAVHDGPGIRTALYFKGCPLRCLWCHNPEGLTAKPELAFYESRCTACGACERRCPLGAHSFEDGSHIYKRELCVGCGACAADCGSGALVFYGKEYSSDELVKIILQDKDFYDTTGGGATLSGGECLLQADFCAELLKKLKENGIHTAVDTCGYVPKELLSKVIPYTDIFLYDLKAYSDEVHIKCTGKSNKTILENLKYIDGCGKTSEIRFPFVTGYNDNEAEGIAKFLSGLHNISAVRLLPYHYPGSKYSVLGKSFAIGHASPDDAALSAAKSIFLKYNIKVV